ncbi:alpha/beta hydrolase-fold protein [Companilactobacillus huachuanensis]|uniref:Alpha/beta hydrolase-fold protein n=1 Tax=Companilactobacillus huachuanensis TaxID=2559914 RepID=A0ABW1RPK7_9LACO|nr:alpha/beta hydrolase-fold protein [Companilactobacillus huachuanensis]
MKSKKSLFIIPILLLLVLVGTACSSSSSSSNSSSSSKKTTSSKSFKKTNTNDAKTDPSLSSVTSSVESEFKQLSYTDKKTGVTLRYALYVPKNYDKKTAYPLLTFIPDDSVTGQSTATGITQGYGGSIWATASEQKKHASFVLIPVFETSTVSGGMGQFGSTVVKKNVNTYLDLLKSLQKKYNINSKRLYGTGQSMGGMTMFYLNSTHPNLFAATLYVSSQWEVSQLSALKNQKFFYIAAGGDENASTGQSNVKSMLKKDNKKYSEVTLDATDSAAKKNTAANKLINSKTNANFITWKAGTVLENSNKGQEHMASFDYGYTVPAVRDWLFNQSK